MLSLKIPTLSKKLQLANNEGRPLLNRQWGVRWEGEDERNYGIELMQRLGRANEGNG
jgi:hypothetical protein